ALPRMAHGRILRTPYPHARIRRVDVSRALSVPGVLAIVTGDDVELRRFGFAKDHPALKRETVRCIRDEVAAVAAETPEIAREAVQLIDVEYDDLAAVFDPEQALEPGAPLVHEDLGSNATPLRYQFVHGDVDGAFAGAAATVEGTYALDFVS